MIFVVFQASHLGCLPVVVLRVLVIVVAWWRGWDAFVIVGFTTSRQLKMDLQWRLVIRWVHWSYYIVHGYLLGGKVL